MCVRMYVHMYACMFVCMYICIYVHMYVCEYVCMCVHTLCLYSENCAVSAFMNEIHYKMNTMY